MDNRSAGLRQYYVGVGTVDAKLPTLVELLQALGVDTRLALAVACSSRDSLDAVVHALASCSSFTLAVLHADLELHELEQQVLQVKRMLQPPPAALQHREVPQETAEATSRVQQQQHLQRADHQQQQQGAPQGVPAAAAVQTPAQAAAGPPAHTEHPLSAINPDTSMPAPAAAGWSDGRSLVLVATDVVLKGLPRELLPLGLPLLIQYDLPASKDVLLRRLAAVFGSSKERSRKAGRQVVIDFVAAGEVAAFRARERLSAAPVMEMPVHVTDIFC